jgi:hypothetical protein
MATGALGKRTKHQQGSKPQINSGTSHVCEPASKRRQMAANDEKVTND